MRQVFGIVFMGFCAAGCTEMLGLDGLTYEEPDAGSASGGARPWKAPGGIGGWDLGRGCDEEVVSLVVSSDAFVVSVDPIGHPDEFWVYEPEMRVFSKYSTTVCGIELSDQYEWSTSLGQSWSSIRSVPLGDEQLFVAYHQETGLLDRAFLAEGDLQHDERSSTSGLTHLIAAPRRDEWELVSYNSFTGNYRWVSALGEARSDTGGGQMAPGWTEMVAFRVEGVDGVLKLNETKGVLAFDAFPDASGELRPEFEIQLEPVEPKTQLLALPGDELRALTYQPRSGGAELLVPRLQSGVWVGDRSSDFGWGFLVGVNALPAELKLTVLSLNPKRIVANNGVLVSVLEAENRQGPVPR